MEPGDDRHKAVVLLARDVTELPTAARGIRDGVTYPKPSFSALSLSSTLKLPDPSLASPFPPPPDQEPARIARVVLEHLEHFRRQANAIADPRSLEGPMSQMDWVGRIEQRRSSFGAWRMADPLVPRAEDELQFPYLVEYRHVVRYRQRLREVDGAFHGPVIGAYAAGTDHPDARNSPIPK